MRALRNRDDAGSALIELTWLGILLLVPLVYLMLSVFEVQRGAFAVSAAARSAGRAYALAESDSRGKADAEAAAKLALADQGLGDAGVGVEISCTPRPHQCHTGGSTIHVRIKSRIDLPLLPDALGGGKPSFRLDADHSVPYGQFQESS